MTRQQPFDTFDPKASVTRFCPMWGPAGAFGAALSFLGTLSFPRRHRQSIEVIGQIHNRHKYQPNRDELKELDLQNVTRRDAKEVDRLYNQLESTGGEPQSGDELNEGGFDREIQEEKSAAR